MTIHTLGTNSNTSLRAFQVGINDLIPADVATMITALKPDPPRWNAATQGTAQPAVNQMYSQTGILYLPNGRGMIKLIQGDYIAWDPDATFWPIVVSAYTVAHGPYHLV